MMHVRTIATGLSTLALAGITIAGIAGCSATGSTTPATAPPAARAPSQAATTAPAPAAPTVTRTAQPAPVVITTAPVSVGCAGGCPAGTVPAGSGTGWVGGAPPRAQVRACGLNPTQPDAWVYTVYASSATSANGQLVAVAEAYKAPGVESVYSTVTGQTYAMACGAYNNSTPHRVIVCTGGQGAYVAFTVS